MSKWDELKRIADICNEQKYLPTDFKTFFGAPLGWVGPQILALIAENEALRKDAERYRWLRDKCHIFQHYKSITWKKDAMDKEIDECMSKDQGNA